MALTKGKQTCLEKKGIEERKEQVSRKQFKDKYKKRIIKVYNNDGPRIY